MRVFWKPASERGSATFVRDRHPSRTDRRSHGSLRSRHWERIQGICVCGTFMLLTHFIHGPTVLVSLVFEAFSSSFLKKKKKENNKRETAIIVHRSTLHDVK